MTQAGLVEKVGGFGAAQFATHFATKAAGRLIPGVGEAWLAYDVFSFGYTKLTGEDWGDTKIGGAINGAASKVGDVAVDGVSGALSMLGMKDAASFVSNSVRPALTGSDGADADPTAATKALGWRSGPFRTAAADDLPPANGALKGPSIDPATLRQTALGPAPDGAAPLSLRQAAMAGPAPTTMLDANTVARDHKKMAAIATATDPDKARSRVMALAETITPETDTGPAKRQTRDQGLSL
jgi:hypothetical protein